MLILEPFQFLIAPLMGRYFRVATPLAPDSQQAALGRENSYLGLSCCFPASFWSGNTILQVLVAWTDTRASNVDLGLC